MGTVEAPITTSDQPVAAPSSRLAAIILAAGQSSRMRGTNKLLRNFDGKPLVLHALEAAYGAGFVAIVIVTGRDRLEIERYVTARKAVAVGPIREFLPARGSAHRNGNSPTPPTVSVIHNPSYAEGLSTSLIAGVQALDDRIDGAAVLLADMPRVTARHLHILTAAFDSGQGQGIVVPTRHGRWGNPMLWSRRFFPEMKRLTGDRGGKTLALEHRESLIEVEMSDDGVLFDIDSEADFNAV